MAFCSFIDNHPWEVKERLEGRAIKEVKFRDDKKSLKMTFEDGAKLEITPNSSEDKGKWLWLFLTE